VTGANTTTITGTDLSAVTAVTFGGQAATIDPGRTATRLKVTVPAALNYQPASVTVQLNGKGGAALSTLTSPYVYKVISPVDRQMQYALEYWQTYNTAQFGNLNPVGGDCANFVSQTLLARGLTMNSQWYSYNAGTKWSAAWGYVPAMDNYFRSNPSLGLTEYSFNERSAIRPGDIVMFDWNNNNSLDHVEVVTKVIDGANGQIQIEAASHNLDYDFRDLDQTITVQHPGATGHFWSFTKPTAQTPAYNG
jgi:Putative amidase domain/IPT/TIG domain